MPILSSVLCIAIPISAIRLGCHEKQVSAVLPLAIFGAFVVGVATILTMIAQRLYAMHEVRRFVFDIPIWFMLVGLLALPLAIASTVANWLASVEPTVDAHKLQAWALIAVIFYFLIVPVFFLTEAIMTLTCVVARTVRHRIIKNGR